tara:strand:+ start:210 stop:677 length:468 start_codon:yes stop_codon:yes gene_type:complete
MLSKLPMRQGVGVIVLNQNNEVFVAKRKDNPIDKWQMPQGGININETPFNAMKRELEEETSITTIKVLKEIDNWLEYELPPNLLGKIWKGKYRGQKQKWFIVKFIGNDGEINLNTKHPEFIEWKWIDYKSLTDVIVDFKKDVYKKLKSELRIFLN